MGNRPSAVWRLCNKEYTEGENISAQATGRPLVWQHKPVPPGFHGLQCMLTKTFVIFDDFCCDSFRHFFANNKKTGKKKIKNQNNFDNIVVKLIENYSDWSTIPKIQMEEFTGICGIFNCCDCNITNSWKNSQEVPKTKSCLWNIQTRFHRSQFSCWNINLALYNRATHFEINLQHYSGKKK